LGENENYPMSDNPINENEEENNSIFFQKKVLIIVDAKDYGILKDITDIDNKFWDIKWTIVDYKFLENYYHQINNLIKRFEIDFILFSQNDQIKYRTPIGPIIRRLNIGYSSISGIDRNYRIDQMKQCYSDFQNRNVKLNFGLSLTDHEKLEGHGKFYLFFDVEQLSCVRYGLPRILSLLNLYHIKGNFFITNLMKEIYPNIVDILVENGHLVGIHGRWHENLVLYNFNEQSRAIKSMIHHFGTKAICANFIGRMNDNTTRACIENDIKYVMYPAINYFRWISYPKKGSEIYSLKEDDKQLLFIPFNVETYGRTWFSVKNMIDNTIRENKESTNKITILMHPFRDGNLQHIDTTKNILEYLVKTKNLSSTLLSEFDEPPNKIREITNITQIFKDLNHKKHNYFPLFREDIQGIIPENYWKLYKLISNWREFRR
jgi:peptidoglycan/xylan/chitin deacetylase (PgdA/CDA1 family)